MALYYSFNLAMLKVQRFVNQLMLSNCYILYDEDTKRCVVVDPGSEKSEREIHFIKENLLSPDYIILTHEHTDHTWGVNSLLDIYDIRVVCSRPCMNNLNKESSAYFRLYYNDPTYHYAVRRVDLTVEEVNYRLHWNGWLAHFLLTPGHSVGSVCVELGNYLFTGDTLMEYRPYIPKRNGSKEEYRKSIEAIVNKYTDKKMIVCPGHGDYTCLDKCLEYVQL